MEEKTNSIDVIALIKTIWSTLKKAIKWAIAGFAIGVVIAFFIQKQYMTSYRTAKTKIDLDRTLAQFEEAKQKYYIADEQYARETV